MPDTGTPAPHHDISAAGRQPRTRLRRPLRITLWTVATLVALPILAVATTSIVNAVATHSELAAIRPYGERVPVDGGRMNVVVSGAGAETIVLLPGLGTAAPGLDFQPLISELDDTHRVVAVEPFGTGLSDQTDSPRTAANIAGEVHEALHHLGVDRYVLMGHSIAGIYALEYSHRYADEVTAFVGIDSSVPDQPGWDEPPATEGLVALRDLGILRVLTAVRGDTFAGLPYDDATKQQMRLLTTKNSTAPTLLDEMDRAPENFASVRGETFPADLPVLLFVAQGDGEEDGWRTLHERQAASVEHGRVVTLRGDHYLHHTRSPEIAADTDVFLAAVPR
ncbi:alpha/beta fold hydrolase [Curtobacterium herbarum]|uniref:AB hydrolase-1 domain-containing protein n=1 Tax=Curtobacterium herbarum TaxID=150122 RepID=A0ABP4K3L1_9MICO|nr:alpha/beta hydrolase [Curtobacterium herbarum]MBM7475682.1 pimeloyl-ACP methyl ester carboxylesterase [Curtobacterium herbarum]MCS6543594.1 alpha/beta hydrolase [Curtobacterium herbarum]